MDWNETVPVENIQLRLLRHTKYPVEQFRKDLQKGKQKPMLPEGKFDPNTGLSYRCSDYKTREELDAKKAQERSIMQQLKKRFENADAKKAGQMALLEEQRFQELCGCEKVQTAFKKDWEWVEYVKGDPKGGGEWVEKKKKEPKQDWTGYKEEWLKP